MPNVTRRVVMVSLVVSALAVVPMTNHVAHATTARTHASYANASIATAALKYVGRWGGDACVDAHRSGMTGSTRSYPDYPDGYTKAPSAQTRIDPNKGGDGQCRSFVNCIVWMASHHTQWLGGEPDGTYFGAFLKAGGVEITDASKLVEGDIVQIGNGTHTFIIVKPMGGNRFDVVDSNEKFDEYVHKHTASVALSKNERAFRMGKATQTVGLAIGSANGSPYLGKELTLDGLKLGPGLKESMLISKLGAPSSCRFTPPNIYDVTARWVGLGVTSQTASLGLAGAGFKDGCKTPWGTYVGSLTLTGSQWHTSQGLRPGDTVARLRQLYPDATADPQTASDLHADGAFQFMMEPCRFGIPGRCSLLSAAVKRGRVSALFIPVGGEGE